MPQKTIEQITLDYLNDPDRWPNWPILPMKRSKNPGIEEGIVLAFQGVERFTVYLVNMWTLPGKPAGWITQQPKVKYTSFEAIVADGWKVD